MTMVINFPDGKPRNEPSEKAAEQAANNAESRKRRLSTAVEIKAAMLDSYKVAEVDRESMARNLGRMWRRAVASGHEIALSDLFSRAFGTRDGQPVNFKKRKRFLLKSPDETPEMQNGKPVFQAAARDYLALASTVAEILSAGQSDDARSEAQNSCVLRLIEGTSLDTQVAPGDRMRSEAVAELNRVCALMVDKVSAHVDLDWMRAAIRHNIVSAVIDANGEVQSLVRPYASWDEIGEAREARISAADPLVDRIVGLPMNYPYTPSNNPHLAQEDADLLTAWNWILSAAKEDDDRESAVRIWPSDFEVDLDEERSIGAEESWSKFAPRVEIGWVYTPQDLESGAFDVRLPVADRNSAETIGGVEAVRRSIKRLGLTDKDFPAWVTERLSEPEGPTEELPASSVFGALMEQYFPQCEDVSELDDFMSKNEIDPWQDAQDFTIWTRRRLYLQLGYDEVGDRWHLCLALSHGVGMGIFGQQGIFGLPERDGGFRPARNFGIQDDLWAADYRTTPSLMAIRIDDETVKFFGVGDEDQAHQEVLGMNSGYLVVGGMGATKAMFKELDDHGNVDGSDLVLFLSDLWTSPAPADRNTLAGRILRNLAYAPDEERIDLKLLKDARRRYQMLKAFVAADVSEYEMAIQRLQH